MTSKRSGESLRIEHAQISGSAFAVGRQAQASAVTSGTSSTLQHLRQAMDELRRELDAMQADDDQAAAIAAAHGGLDALAKEVSEPEPRPQRVKAFLESIRSGLAGVASVAASVVTLETAVQSFLG